MVRAHLQVAASVLLAALGSACRSEARAPAPEDTSFLELRASHPTQLTVRSSLDRVFDNDALDERYTAVTFPGADPGAALRGWIAPAEPSQGAAPLLVYLHGNFSLTATQLAEVREHVPPSFGVFAPTWRSENGNPGAFELLGGEVQDAAAAIRWAAAREAFDASRIYVVGHSVGGGIAALLTLEPDLPVAETVSVGGIYTPKTFERWSVSKSNAELIRFDPHDPAETRLRTLAANAADMRRGHIAYVGNEDTWFHPNVHALESAAQAAGASVEVVFVDGDHMSSLPVALDAYFGRIGTTSTARRVEAP